MDDDDPWNDAWSKHARSGQAVRFPRKDPKDLLPRKVEDLPRVEVEWIDACGGIGWGKCDAVVKHYRENPTRCWSIGYLLDETDNHILLVDTISGNVGVNGHTHIPRGMVVSVKPLELSSRDPGWEARGALLMAELEKDALDASSDDTTEAEEAA